MSNVDGAWSCSVETPLGTQSFVLTVTTNGDQFTGDASGDLGHRDITDGTVEGDTLHWTMSVTKPMPITLTCEGTVSGDSIEGTMSAGVFGRFGFSGTRR